MKRKIVAMVLALALALTLVAYGEEKETTITGMVVSVEGSVLSLVELDTGNMGGMDFADGERPGMPEGMEGFGGFDPGEFEGTLPEGGNFPNGGSPEGMEPPEGMTVPENGELPNFGSEIGSPMPNFGDFGENMETRDVDISGAHISVEIDGGKAFGSMDDITAGTFVTITMNSKGAATYVLISSQMRFDKR